MLSDTIRLIDIIKKQSKEIEELKNITNSYDSFLGENKIIIADKKFFDNGYFKENYISVNKIKAKVIEVKNRAVKNEFITASQGKLNTIIELESLLDKE